MKQLEKNLTDLYRSLLNREFIAKQVGKSCHPEYEMSAINLVRYLTLRNFDLRKVHDHLSELGISSLRSSEAYVWRNVSSALKLVKLLNREYWEPDTTVRSIGYKKSKKLLNKHASHLFKISNRSKLPRIMVSIPSEGLKDDTLIPDLLLQGMEVARIDLSYDNPTVWRSLIEKIRKESNRLNKECNIYLDLAGPNIKTGSITIERKKSKNSGPRKSIRLFNGDHLILHDDIKNASECIRGPRGELISSAGIGISPSSILNDVAVGDRIIFDKGKIIAEVIAKKKEKVITIIKKANKKGSKLRAHKSINLPDTHLNLPTLTDEDRRNISFVCENADIVGYSFVRTPEDVAHLHETLEKNGCKNIGIVLKIENNEAFENLPLVLLEAMKWPSVGVMIARGDLSIDIGLERIAEVQDQILWLCEAAHIPVIWANDVLDTLAKSGQATRSEVTDAAKSSRAECVLLNSGPHIVKTVEMLGNILVRMNNHTSKKKSIMRSLKVAQNNIDKLGTVIKKAEVST